MYIKYTKTPLPNLHAHQLIRFRVRAMILTNVARYIRTSNGAHFLYAFNIYFVEYNQGFASDSREDVYWKRFTIFLTCYLGHCCLSQATNWPGFLF